MSDNKEPMSKDDYIEMQNLLMLYSEAVAQMDLEPFIEAARKADVLGPILDPTLYIKAGKKLRAVRKIAVAALAFKTVYMEEKKVFQE